MVIKIVKVKRIFFFKLLIFIKRFFTNYLLLLQVRLILKTLASSNLIKQLESLNSQRLSIVKILNVIKSELLLAT